MKQLFLLTIVLQIQMSFAANSSDRDMAVRDKLAVAVLEFYTTERLTAVPVIFFSCPGVDAASIIKQLGRRPIKAVLKPGSGYKRLRGKLVDPESGLACEAFRVEFVEVGEHRATVKVEWRGSSGDWCIYELFLKPQDQNWIVAENKVYLVP